MALSAPAWSWMVDSSTRSPAQHEQLEDGRAAHQVASVGVSGEGDAVADEVVGQAQATGKGHEPLVGERAHRLAAHLADEVIQTEITRRHVHT